MEFNENSFELWTLLYIFQMTVNIFENCSICVDVVYFRTAQILFEFQMIVNCVVH